MAERQPTNQLDADDCEEKQYAEFKKQLKIFHEKYKRQIDWLKANGFHEVIDEAYMEVEYRNGRKNAKNYLAVLPSFADLGGWRCVAVINGAWEYGTDAIDKHHPNLAIMKSMTKMRKMQEKLFKQIYKNL